MGGDLVVGHGLSHSGCVGGGRGEMRRTLSCQWLTQLLVSVVKDSWLKGNACGGRSDGRWCYCLWILNYLKCMGLFFSRLSKGFRS